MAIISPKEIKYTRWYLANKDKIKNFIYIILTFLIVLWWGIFAYNLVIYIQNTELHQENLKLLTQDRIDYAALHDHIKPADILILKNTALESKENFYDFLTKVSNPNEYWRVKSLKYRYSWGNNKTKLKEIFVLPKSFAFATFFQKEIGSFEKIDFIIEDIDWKRIKRKDRDRLNILSKIDISNAQIDFMVPKNEMVSIPVVNFDITNNSIYSFWDIPCLIILYNRANKIVGIDRLPVKELMSEETRNMRLSWPNIPATQSIKVVPLLDIFDKDVYMPVK